MQTAYVRAATLPNSEINNLYAYRHAVFVDRLKWDLPMARDGLEIDQFDRPDTIHIMARKPDGTLCGCARLLPTNSPYLLGDVFPQLMHGAPLPNSVDVWEISRFCSFDTEVDAPSRPSRQADEWGCRQVLAATVECAIEVGAKRLVAVCSLAIERILYRLGVNAYRAGPSMKVGGHTIFAFWIEIDEQTKAALGL